MTDKLTDRLRNREDGLRTRRAPDGGEVMTGELASQALKAIGARAMTMDNTVFVDEGFDPSNNPEDLALLAHERHHQGESGGTDQHGEFDLEELASRARERMVLHLARQGGDPAEILKKAQDGPNDYDQVQKMIDVGGAGNPFLPDGHSPDPMFAYRKMIADGLSHEEVVDLLAEKALNAMKRQRPE